MIMKHNTALWQQLRDSMEHSQSLLQEALNPTMETFTSTLAARARKLADSLGSTFDTRNQKSLLHFDSEGEPFAIAAQYCMGVVLHPELYPVPGAASKLSGLIGFKASVVPLFRPAGIKRAGYSRPVCALVIGTAKAEFALHIDSVPELLWSESNEFSADYPTHDGFFSGSVSGIGEEGRMLLDGESLLASHHFDCSNEESSGEQ